MLETIPEGFSLELNALPGRIANGPFFYEATYTNQAGDYFIIRAFGNKPLEDTSWADHHCQWIGTPFRCPTGYHRKRRRVYRGLLETPEGMTFAIDSTLPREQVKALAEELVLVK